MGVVIPYLVMQIEGTPSTPLPASGSYPELVTPSSHPHNACKCTQKFLPSLLEPSITSSTSFCFQIA